ncbi:hypothetical protein RVN83_00245 [Streptomyces sp. PU10]|uniref:hypothetical protein n=1 Tax=unclassified Streptomyces TaxID=2593676 RepID=UPI0028FC5221|nr:hypothetical protein [Streptomyces sp. PU10]MDU0251766.1 hypothetical protein [Streptomyces sp. PU10]
MTEVMPYWEIATLKIREEVPGVTFSVFIGDGEDAAENGFYFDFHRFLNDYPDEQNVRNGTDSYSVVNESLGVHYGGVEGASRAGDILTLEFSDEAIEVLNLPSSVIPLRIAPEVALNELLSSLKYVLLYGDPRKRSSLILE